MALIFIGSGIPSISQILCRFPIFIHPVLSVAFLSFLISCISGSVSGLPWLIFWLVLPILLKPPELWLSGRFFCGFRNLYHFIYK
ncbi:MAG: hypothetical protein ACFNYI_04705, partial [Eubacterium sp.]